MATAKTPRIMETDAKLRPTAVAGERSPYPTVVLGRKQARKGSKRHAQVGS